jgi:hypothetical protein
MNTKVTTSKNLRWAKKLWQEVSAVSLESLREISELYGFSITLGDLLYLNGTWYVTHTGLLRLAQRKACAGIEAKPIAAFCDMSVSKWAFKATVFKTRNGRPFTGYGDADHANVAPLVRGAEMRIAETRAVNRALRKAYGIGICSVEEIGSLDGAQRPLRKLPPQNSNGNGKNGHSDVENGNGNGTRVRDRLCQLIRQHNLDAEFVKAYAVDFCGTKTLREATREQVEKFVDHLADWAEQDRDALVCQLNSYSRSQSGAA